MRFLSRGEQLVDDNAERAASHVVRARKKNLVPAALICYNQYWTQILQAPEVARTLEAIDIFSFQPEIVILTAFLSLLLRL